MELKYEWQPLTKDMNLQCRTKIDDSELFVDNVEVDIKKFLKNSFIKFSVHIYKWNKETFDVYAVDILMIKAGIPNMFLNKISELVEVLRSKASLSPYLQILSTFNLAEEAYPYRGQGFEIVPFIQYPSYL